MNMISCENKSNIKKICENKSDCNIDEMCRNSICMKDPFYCSEEAPFGKCNEGFICNSGKCEEQKNCSVDNPNGKCEEWFECVNGVCVEEQWKMFKPTTEMMNDFKVNEPFTPNENMFFTDLHYVQYEDYKKVTENGFNALYDITKKQVTHIFTIDDNISVNPFIFNPADSCYYFIDIIGDTSYYLVGLDPKVGKTEILGNFDDLIYPQLIHITKKGNFLIETGKGCQGDNKPGLLSYVFNFETKEKKEFCLPNVPYYYNINDDIYSYAGNEYEGISLYKLNIDERSYEKIAELEYKGHNIGFSEDGLLFFSMNKNELYVHDIYSKESKKMDIDFSSLLENITERVVIGKTVYDGKYLYLNLSIYDSNNEVKTAYWLKINIKTLQYKKIYQKIGAISVRFYKYLNLISISNRMFLNLTDKTMYFVLPSPHDITVKNKIK